MSTPDRWAKAYARQANADFETWNALVPNRLIPECHKLLFLQMACEKLVKAHLCSKGTDPVNVQASHGFTAKNLPIIVREHLVSIGKKTNEIVWILKHAKHLASEIELLAPAVRRGGQRPDNCEYPWEDSGGTLRVPLDWAFRPTNLIVDAAGRTFIKVVRAAVTELLV